MPDLVFNIGRDVQVAGTGGPRQVELWVGWSEGDGRDDGMTLCGDYNDLKRLGKQIISVSQSLRDAAEYKWPKKKLKKKP